VESWQRRKDGEKRLLAWQCRVLKDERGKVSGSLSSASDITERRQAEEALLKSEENLSVTLHSIGDGVITTDMNGFVVKMNPVAETLCGWLLADAAGRPLSEVFKIINAETLENVVDPVKKVLEHGEIVGLANHTVLVSRNGANYQIADSAAPIKTKDGEITGVVLVFSDVTEKYAAEIAIKESEEKYRLLAENATDVIWVMDVESDIFRYVSPSVEHLRGFTAEEVMQQPLEAALTPASMEYLRSVVPGRLARFRQGQIEFFHDEFEQIHKDGHTIWTEVNARYYVNRANGRVEATGATRDITARKQAEQIILESQARLSEALEASNRSRYAMLSVLEDQHRSEQEIQKLNAELEDRVAERTRQLEIANKDLQFHLSELEQFSYVSNHDLQEPLRTLTQFTQLFSEKYAETLDGDGQKYLEFISKSATRMKLLVRDLFEYTLLGKESVITIIDCNIIVDAVLSDLEDSIKERNAKISVQKLPIVNGYETEMRLLFQNLITNAIKYQKQDMVPEIHISVESHEKEWVFSIEDNGIGIDQKYYEKIFIIFQRLHNRNEYEGTGIGLAHCKKIVEMHGGRIWVKANAGAGCTFLFTIPK